MATLAFSVTRESIARSTHTVANTGYTWHSAPDGGACFADGTGWIYASVRTPCR